METTTEAGAGWLTKAIAQFIGITIGTLFLVLLFAPMFSEVFEKPLVRRYCLYPNHEELVRRDMRPIKHTLWALCVVSWIVVLAANL